MRAFIQRVKSAQATYQDPSNKNTGPAIKQGMLILCGFESSDSPIIIEQLAQKIKSLRIFSDKEGKMNLAGNEVGGEYLLVSQFTLYADCRYGNRPSFEKAAPKPKAQEYYEFFVKTFERLMGEERVKHTPFGSDLDVGLVNDGPASFLLDSKEILPH